MDNAQDYISRWQYSTPTSAAISIGRLTLYFSYSTVIAFNSGGKTVISENYWSTTTGKHLNVINPDHKIRIKSDEFNKLLNKAMKKHKLNLE